MPFNSSFLTYAVSLHFSADVNDIIASAVKSIAEVTGCNFITENKIPPHVTIGAFHAVKEDEEKLIQTVKDFAKAQKADAVHFKEIGNFNEKVLFLKPEKNNFLTQINSELHKTLLPEFEKAENGYYLPEFWFPHTTLATRLSKIQFAKALKIAEQIPFPLETPATEIAVYQCSPFKEIKRFEIL